MVANFDQQSDQVDLLGNPIIGAIVAGGVSLAGLIVGGVAKKRQREAESRAVSKQQDIQAAAAKSAAAAKTGNFNIALATIPAAAVFGVLLLKKLKK